MDRTPDQIYLMDMGDEIAWCDDPAPGAEMNADDAVKYVRADIIEQLQQEHDAKVIVDAVNTVGVRCIQGEVYIVADSLKEYAENLRESK